MSVSTITIEHAIKKALSIHPLTLDHLSCVLSIEKRTHLTPWNEVHFRDAINGRQQVWGLFDGQVLLGYAVFSIIAKEAELLLFVIDEVQQGAGLGKVLLQALIKHYQAYAETLFLEVRASNIPAISLYEKLGFNQVGERPNYYSTPWGREDALVYAFDCRCSS